MNTKYKFCFLSWLLFLGNGCSDDNHHVIYDSYSPPSSTNENSENVDANTLSEVESSSCDPALEPSVSESIRLIDLKYENTDPEIWKRMSIRYQNKSCDTLKLQLSPAISGFQYFTVGYLRSWVKPLDVTTASLNPPQYAIKNERVFAAAVEIRAPLGTTEIGPNEIPVEYEGASGSVSLSIGYLEQVPDGRYQYDLEWLGEITAVDLFDVINNHDSLDSLSYIATVKNHQVVKLEKLH